MRTIAIINQKGGSGKTTTAVNLAAALARLGRRVLLVDTDPQSHCALGLAIPESQIDLSIADAMLAPDHRPPERSRLIWNVAKGLDLIPSTTRLASLEAARGGLAEREDRDRRLAAALSHHAPAYDWCLIDCPPFIGLLTFNALRAADEVLIPVETAYFALHGAAKQVSTIHALGRRFGLTVPYRVLPTLHHADTALAADVLMELERRFASALIPVAVRYDARLKEAASIGVPIVEFDADSPGAADYTALARFYENTPRLVSESIDEPVPSIIVTEPKLSISRESMAGASIGQDPPAADFRDPHPPHPIPRPVFQLSRAAELAERARRLAGRNAELAAQLASDAEIARELRDIDRETPCLRIARAAPIPAGYPQTTGRGTLFSLEASPESRVSLAGDHNAWRPDRTPMSYNPLTGRHEVLIALHPGKLRYRFVVDAEWVNDPSNPSTETNSLGQIDSIIFVPTPAEIAVHTPAHPATPAAIPA